MLTVDVEGLVGVDRSTMHDSVDQTVHLLMNPAISRHDPSLLSLFRLLFLVLASHCQECLVSRQVSGSTVTV